MPPLSKTWRIFRGKRFLATQVVENYLLEKTTPALTLKLRQFMSQANIVESHLSDRDIPRTHISHYVWQQAKNHPNKIILEDAITKDKLTFQEATSKCRSFGSSLLRLGLVKGDVIALVLPNCIEYMVLFLGAADIGATITTINPAYTSGEIMRQLNGSRAKFVVTSADMVDKVEEAVMQSQIKIILHGDDPGKHISLRMLLQDSGDQYLENASCNPEEDVVVLPYSSGTTGAPKGVMLTHMNLVANMHQMNHPSLDLMEPHQVLLSVLPMFHIYGMVLILNCLVNIGTVVVLPTFDPKTFLEGLLEHRPKSLPLVPPLVNFLANHPDVTPDHLSSVETAFVGAAPLGKALIDKFHCRAPGVVFREGYGMSELSPCVTFTSKDRVVEGSAGQLISNTRMKVVDLETGEALGPGQRGEFCFSGPQVMAGYLDNPTATNETIREGWLHTGDIGHYDQDKNVYIMDRLKELIKVKGLQVAPAELEDVIRLVSGVTDVAVIGIDDERSGEVPRAYVVRDTQDLTESDIKAFVAKELSVHKHLAGGVEFVKEIPKSAAGKILRKDIKEAYLNNV